MRARCYNLSQVCDVLVVSSSRRAWRMELMACAGPNVLGHFVSDQRLSTINQSSVIFQESINQSIILQGLSSYSASINQSISRDSRYTQNQSINQSIDQSINHSPGTLVILRIVSRVITVMSSGPGHLMNPSRACCLGGPLYRLPFWGGAPPKGEAPSNVEVVMFVCPSCVFTTSP